MCMVLRLETRHWHRLRVITGQTMISDGRYPCHGEEDTNGTEGGLHGRDRTGVLGNTFRTGMRASRVETTRWWPFFFGEFVAIVKTLGRRIRCAKAVEKSEDERPLRATLPGGTLQVHDIIVSTDKRHGPQDLGHCTKYHNHSTPFRIFTG